MTNQFDEAAGNIIGDVLRPYHKVNSGICRDNEFWENRTIKQKVKCEPVDYKKPE